VTGTSDLRSVLPIALLAIVGCGATRMPATHPLAGPRTLAGEIDTILTAPMGSPYGVAAARGIAYVTLHGDTSALSIWDFRDRSYRHAVIPTGFAPTNVAFSPNGRSAYVASQLSYRVERVDVRRARIDGKWHTPANDPFQVAVSPDGGSAYATGNAGWLYAFDAASGRSRGAIEVDRDPNGVTVTADGRRAFITHIGSPAIGVVDLERASYRQFAWMDDVEGQGIVLSRDEQAIFTVSEDAGRLYAFDAVTGGRIGWVATGPSPFGLALTPDGRELWVTTLEGRLLRFSADDLSPIGSLAIGGRLRRLAFDPEGRGAVIADEQGRIIVMR
jgi:DNA-binding beta-propeller fold protein YncE